MSLKSYKIDLSGFEGKVKELITDAITKHAVSLGYVNVVEDHKARVFVYSLLGGVDSVSISASDFLALEPEKTPDFHPFDKILVKDKDDTEWRPAFFWEVAEDGRFRESTGDVWDECVPYEGNEGLLK